MCDISADIDRTTQPVPCLKIGHIPQGLHLRCLISPESRKVLEYFILGIVSQRLFLT